MVDEKALKKYPTIDVKNKMYVGNTKEKDSYKSEIGRKENN